MKVFYTGTYPEGGKVSAFGATFEEGKSSDVDDKFKDKVAGNPFFATDAKDAKKAEKEHDEAGLKAEHHGGGRFNITKGETVVQQGLTKAQADEFNAMDDKAKAAFVKSQS
jgi:hypothetical protein